MTVRCVHVGPIAIVMYVGSAKTWTSSPIDAAISLSVCSIASVAIPAR
jgi:hypothetical protein